MKHLTKGACIALLILCYFSAAAQQPTAPLNEPRFNKKRIFADLPERIRLKLSGLESLLQLPIGAEVSPVIGDGIVFKGTIVSKSNPVDTLVRSVVIKLADRIESILTFSRVRKHDGSISFTGRVTSKESGDALEITKEGNDYFIRKKSIQDMVNE